MTIALQVLLIVLGTTGAFSVVGILYVRKKRLSVEEYIVHRNSAGTGLAFSTVAASGLGAWLLFSPSETGTWAGIAGLTGYSIGMVTPLLVFAFLGPRMRSLMPGGHSLSEYLWYRFGQPVYLFGLAIMLFYMLTYLSAELTGIALVVRLIADIPLYWTALIVAVGTLIYTTYGGLRASIFTDRIQFALIVPLLVVVFIVTLAAQGGWEKAFMPVARMRPELLSMSHVAGLEFGASLVIAMVAANMFNQGYWQRVYACRNETVLRKAFPAAGVVGIPFVMMTGLLGVAAISLGLPAEESSTALFFLITRTLPTWVVMMVIVLALMLVMSSMDTLLNGIASIVISDLHRIRPEITASRLMLSSRVITVLAAVPIVLIASQGYSVLYLFLVADLVCAGAVFPFMYGLYAKYLSGKAALICSLAGILTGALFFPNPDFQPWLNIPLGGSFLASFGSAFLLSLICTVISDFLGYRSGMQKYDFNRLSREILTIKE